MSVWSKFKQGWVDFFDTEPGSLVWVVRKVVQWFKVFADALGTWLSETLSSDKDDDEIMSAEEEATEPADDSDEGDEVRRNVS